MKTTCYPGMSIRCICLMSALSASAVLAKAPTIAESEFKEFQTRWNDAAESLGVPGWAVVAVRNDKVVMLDGAGMRNVETGAPVTPETMFYIASCTKPYVAMATVSLAEDKLLDLDAPVKTYLPQLALPDAKLTGQLTVRDLLCHRYGINSGAIVFNDAYTGLISDSLYFRLLKDAEIAGHVDYTNVHFTLTGRVVSAVTRKDWRDVLQDRIFQPAGMTRTTGYASRMYNDSNVAVPHVYDGTWKPSPLVKTDRTMHAAGGLGTTAADLGRWMRLNLNRGQIDGKRVIAETVADNMVTFQSRLAEPDGKIRIMQGFGLGWQLGSYRDQTRLVAHGGGYAGTAAYIAMMPEKGFGVAILANCDDPGQALCATIMIDLFDKVLDAERTKDLLPVFTQMAERWRGRQSATPAGTLEMNPKNCSARASAYDGDYTNKDFGILTLRIRNGRLVGSIGDLPLIIRWTGRDACTAIASPGTSFDGTFETQGDNVIAVNLDEMRFVRD